MKPQLLLLWRLRAYAFFHGLAFHALLHTVYLKEVLLGGSYEALALLSALQVLALWITEAFSGTLCRQIGCWRVLRMCGYMRLVALACLGTSVFINNNNNNMVIFLLLVWSLCEGVARALYSGSDVQLIYELSSSSKEDEDASHNLAIQHGMWPLAMVLSTASVSMLTKPNMALLIGCSWLTAFLGLVAVYDVDNSSSSSSSNYAKIPWKSLQPDCIWRANKKAFKQVWYNSHLRSAWFTSIIFTLLSETLNRLRHFSIPGHTSALVVVLSFFGSFVGSTYLSGFLLLSPLTRQKNRCGIRIPLLVYILAPWLWYTDVDVFVYIGSFSVSLAFGALKSHFQSSLFRIKELPLVSKSEILSTLNLSNQMVHSIWMCFIVSPLLDWRPELLRPWIIAGNSFLFSIALIIRQ